jgi:DNA polymerase III delta prime subunit
MEEISKRIWVERYRPTTIQELILPDRIKKELQSFADKKEIPNLLFYSPGGMGKTSAMKALISELDMDFIELNGSLDTSIESVRDKIVSFASTVSLINNNQKKCIAITEADGFSTEAKNSLKNLIEKFSSNIRIIFDTNYVDKIPQPIRSRCVEYDFTFDRKEYPELQKQMFSKCISILEENNITYNKKDVADLIKSRFPDMRKIINDLQKSSMTGEFIISNDSPEELLVELITSYKEQSFEKIRNTVKNIADYDGMILKLYKSIDMVEKKSIPNFILILGDYQYKSMVCLSKEINFLCMVVEMLSKGVILK